ncbi:hypothetical protein [Brevibacillus laterosporus]|uniref:hypothetical protein n=1 Tax=Brevibacillus laterosporus TaxID=1465 RepID=UPI00215C0C4C|nr:hypothetical protein [Brevibacillus laterosporus]MCR8994602.1 hypothetical protein [Brevibacillus laterosporus]
MTIEYIIDGKVYMEQMFKQNTYGKSIVIAKARCRNLSVSGRNIGWRFKGLEHVHYMPNVN